MKPMQTAQKIVQRPTLYIVEKATITQLHNINATNMPPNVACIIQHDKQSTSKYRNPISYGAVTGCEFTFLFVSASADMLTPPLSPSLAKPHDTRFSGACLGAS